MWTTKGPSTAYYNYEHTVIVRELQRKLYCDRSIITGGTTLTSRPDIVIFVKTIRESIIDVAIPNSHKMYSTFTEKLQKYTDLKEGLKKI